MSQCYDEFQFTWILENYVFCDEENGLFSPLFSDDENFISNPYCSSFGSKWKICIYPKGKNKKSKGYVSLDFTRCHFNTFLKEKIIRVQLSNADDEVIFESCEEKTTHPQFILKLLKAEELEKKLKKTSKDTLIVRCWIRKDKMSTMQRLCNGTTKNDCTVKTTIDFDKFSLDLKISSFIFYPDTIINKILSDTDKTQFELSYKTTLGEEASIEIKRHKKPFSIQNHKVKCRMSLLNSDRVEVVSCTEFFFYNLKKNIWNFPTFFKESDLNSYRSYDFTLKVDLFVSNDLSVHEYIENPENIIHSSPNKVSDSLANDFSSDYLHCLLFSNKFVDVNLRVEKEVVRAHKLILASRSPVFSAMFDQGIMEDQTETIDIANMKANTLKLLLKFLYTGELDETDNKAMLELLMAAEKYQVPSLRNKCCQILTLHLDSDNVCDVVTVADMLGHVDLKIMAIDYINENAAEILGSSKWLDFIEKNVKLGSEILCKLSDIIKTAR